MEPLQMEFCITFHLHWFMSTVTCLFDHYIIQGVSANQQNSHPVKLLRIAGLCLTRHRQCAKEYYLCESLYIRPTTDSACCLAAASCSLYLSTAIRMAQTLRYSLWLSTSIAGQTPPWGQLQALGRVSNRRGNHGTLQSHRAPAQCGAGGLAGGR